jgi:catechol 2,3-dioxygenase-like lactoylglutathione lyase family enzyme
MATDRPREGDLPERPPTEPISARLSPVTLEAPRISLIVLYSDDIQACRIFYENLGLNFVVEHHEKGPEHFAGVLTDGGVLELYPSGSQGPTSALRIGLTVPHSLPKGRRLTVGTHLLRDPDNRMVEVTVV